MARYTATVEATEPLEDLFAYMSDFSTVAEWDPGVKSARRLDEGPVQVGSRFEVVASSLGRDIELVYEVLELEPGRRVLLFAEKSLFASRDEMTFEPRDKGSAVTYDAQVLLKGPIRLMDPLMSVAFKRTGDSAVAGMRRTFATRSRAARAKRAA